VNWISRVSGQSHPLNGIAFGGGNFVAVGGSCFQFSYASKKILSSSDGVNWDIRVSDEGSCQSVSPLFGVTYGNGTFVTVGSSETIMTSQNGINWSTRVPVSDQSLSGVAFGNNTFVAVGGEIIQSDPLTGQITTFIKANNLSGIVNLKSNDTVLLEISLDPANLSDVNADWWVVLPTQCGFTTCWYYYVYPDQWQFAFDLADVKPTYQGPLFNLDPIEVLRSSGFLPGTYVIYFGVDTNMNEQIDYDQLYLDYVLINVVP
jgi:hypothetical protein